MHDDITVRRKEGGRRRLTISGGIISLPLNCSPFLLSTSAAAAASMNRAAILGLPPFRAHRQSHPKYLEADWTTNISVLKHPQPNPGALADSATNFTSSNFFCQRQPEKFDIGPTRGDLPRVRTYRDVEKGDEPQVALFFSKISQP